MSIAIRPYVPDLDRPARLDVFNRANAEIEGFVPDTLEMLEQYDRSPNEANRRRFIAELDGTPVGVASADVYPELAEPKGFISGPHVVPEARRRGVGTALVAAAIGDLRGRGKRLVEVDALDRPGPNEFAAALGLAPVRSFSNLRRRLSDLPAVPAGVEIIPVELEDDNLAEYVRLWNDAFSEYYDFFPWTVERARFARDSIRKTQGDVERFAFARVGEERVGFVLVVYSPRDNEKLGIKRGGVWDIGVSKPFRGRGIASTLITYGMHWLRDSGMAEVELWVDDLNVTNARGLYEHLGFRVVRRSITYRKNISGP